jgi:peptidoglycan/xylan/chitin deacetylase (PgdA/CDA1 family)
VARSARQRRSPLAALSIDLDEIGCYTAIHGLAPPDDDAANAIYRAAIPRYEAMLDDLGIRATFFAIGTDLARDENREALRRLRSAGHEIGNHSLHHYYDLTRRDSTIVREEIDGGAAAIERAIGERPTGFRAPGYTIDDRVLAQLMDAGYAYDSSVFPCPAYYGAKATAIGAISLAGRTSHSVVDTPRVLTAPADPYRVATPYWLRGQGLLELPIGVTRGARLPYIGTYVAVAGVRGARLLTRLMRGRPLVNLELHGIDLSDAREDGLSFLVRHQFDLRVSARAKEAALRSAVHELRRGGYTFVTLAEAAERFADA